MKKKITSTDNYLANIKPNIQINFGSVSPFSAISFPQSKTIFGAWYGNISLGSVPGISLGTLEVARQGEGTVVMDFDKYVFYSTGTASILQIDGPQKPLYHWSSNIPSHLKNQAPGWVIDLVDKEKNKR